MCRWVYTCHVLSLVLELAVMAVMFLNVASHSRNTHKELDQHASGDQIAIMVLSLCITLATFVLTMIGAGSALAGLRVVAMHISFAGTNMVHPRGSSAAGCGFKVKPLEGTVDVVVAGPAHQEPLSSDMC